MKHVLFPCPIQVNNSLLPARVFITYRIKTVVLRMILILSIYLFIRHTPSYEYYVPGSPQHAIKVGVKNKADRENRIKVCSVSVLNSRNKKK